MSCRPELMLSVKQYRVLNLRQILTPTGAQSAMFAICVPPIGLGTDPQASVAQTQRESNSMTYNLPCDPARDRTRGQQNANCRTTYPPEAQFYCGGRQRTVLSAIEIYRQSRDITHQW
jgi:hypothetical protein